MKIMIFGSSGMLGRYMVSYLSKKHTVVGLTRNNLDIFQCFQKGTLNKNIEDLISKHLPRYIINCSGCINKRPELSVSEMYIVNGYFPHILSKICEQQEIKLFHPSTDCVFSGSSDMYENISVPDCCEDYGASKSVAESIKAMVIRVSIIGEETNNRSLVEWIKNSKGQTINGYTNHFWNGITCLEYAKLVEKIIGENTHAIGIFNYFSTYKGKNYITKYELVKEISDIYNLNLTVIPCETNKSCNRTLRGEKMGKDITEQINEMKEYNFN